MKSFFLQAKCFLWFFAPMLALSGCSLRLHEPEVKPQAFNIRSESQVCLSQTGSVVERFLEGKASESEIDNFWGCLERSVQFFLKNTVGEDPNSYKPRELANFLGKYFLNNVQVSDSMIAQVMRLKQGLFSGRSDKLTREEIQGFLRLFSAFSAASKALAPHMPISPTALVARTEAATKIEETLAALDSAASSLASAMDEGLGQYSMSDLSALLRETRSFFQANGWSVKWVESIDPYLPVVASLKGIAISPPRDKMLPADWRRFFQLAPRYYALYLRYQLSFGQKKIELKGEGLYQLVNLLDRGMPLLEESLKARRVPIVNAEEIDDLLDRAEELKLLPYPKVQVREVLALALKRFLPDPEAKGRLQISAKNLKELRTLYIYFTDGLREIDGALLKELGERDFSFGQFLRAKARALFPGNRSFFTFFNTEATKVAAADLRTNVDAINISFDPRAKFAVVRENGSLPLSRFHLQRMHYLRTLNKLLLRAYGDSAKETISQRQILTMLTDLEPAFRLFKIDGADLRSAVPARLFEGSLFLPSSDGEFTLKMTEALELETLFLSVIQMAPPVHKMLARACRASSGRVELNCYRKAFSERLAESWKNVPGLAAALQPLDLEQRTTLLTQLDGFLRKGKTDQPYVEGDTKSLLLMGYYIELLFFRFDQNRNGQIEAEEARNAFPLFRGFIAKKATELGRKDPAEHYKIFTYILSHRKVPKTFWDKIGYLNWKPEQEFGIDRAGTLEVFSTLLSF